MNSQFEASTSNYQQKANNVSDAASIIGKVRGTETAEGLVSRGLLMLQRDAANSLERSKEL